MKEASPIGGMCWAFLWQLKFQCHLSKEDWPIWMTPCETLRADVLVVPFLVENNKLEFNHQVDISRTKGAKPRIRLEMRIRVLARYVWIPRYLVLVVASVSFPSLCMSWEAEGKSTNYRATPPDDCCLISIMLCWSPLRGIADNIACCTVALA